MSVLPSLHSKHATFPLHPTYVQRRQSPVCRIRCPDVCTAPAFLPTKCLISVTFPEVIWVKTASCNGCTAFGRAPVRTPTTPSAGEDLEQREGSPPPGGSVKWYSRLGRWFGGFLRGQTQAYHLILQSRSLVLRKGAEKGCPHKTCPQMFMAALFITVETLKQPRRTSVGKGINKPCFFQTMEYYSLVKRKELSSLEKTQRKLKCVLVK